jgi:hypothetical protein
MQHKRMIVLCQGIALSALWVFGLPILQAQETPPAQVEKAVKAKKPKKSDVDNPPANPAPAVTNPAKRAAPAPVQNATSEEIQSAKAAGKVWVNTESGVYHKSGKWFGTTKQGKFMSEQDATKAGYRAAKNEK